MRVTAEELNTLLARLPPAQKHRSELITLAIQGTASTRPHHLTVPLKAELRVVTFHKARPSDKREAPVWELELT